MLVFLLSHQAHIVFSALSLLAQPHASGRVAVSPECPWHLPALVLRDFG